MKKLLALLLLLALTACQTLHTPAVKPYYLIVRYNDNITDTLRTTDYSYRIGKLEYIEECSCDGLIISKRY